jgi:hypothetical protein
LAEFDRATQREPQPAADTAQPNGDTAAQPTDDVDAFLASLDTSSADRQRIDQLTGEIDGLKAAELDRQSRADFEGFAKQLQSQCGPNCPDDYARTTLLSMAMERPELQAAWHHRHLTNEQRRAAELEFKSLEVLYDQVRRSPDDDPRKAQALTQIEQRGAQLNQMLTARQLLNGAWKDVRNRADKVKPPIDPEATQVHGEISQYMRGAGGKVEPEPPPRFGEMTDSELREYTRKNFGFE